MDIHTVCEKCKKSLTAVYRCSLCKSVYYCSKECQCSDWANHKEKCNTHSPEDMKKELGINTKDFKGKYNMFENRVKRGEKNILNFHKDCIFLHRSIDFKYTAVPDNEYLDRYPGCKGMVTLQDRHKSIYFAYEWKIHGVYHVKLAKLVGE